MVLLVVVMAQLHTGLSSRARELMELANCFCLLLVLVHPYNAEVLAEKGLAYWRPRSSAKEAWTWAPVEYFHRLPRRIRFALAIVGGNLALFTLCRIIFCVVFRSTAQAPSLTDLVHAFYLGLKFDLRLALFIALPMLALSWIPGLSRPRSGVFRWVWAVCFFMVGISLIFMYFVDLGHYDYLHERLNANATDPFVSAVALNPVLNFFDTREYRERAFDEDAVRKDYELVAHLLRVDKPDSATLSFARRVTPQQKLPGQPNLVLILLESFSGSKVGVLGNTLNATPRFDAIARKSLLFTNFFITRPPTARAVFTVLFGIPDIHSPHSASRNPLIVRQHTIANALEGYRKCTSSGGVRTGATSEAS